MPKGTVLRRNYDLVKEGFTRNDGGIYCMTPYNINAEGYGLFKVGCSVNFIKRFESYYQYHPSGVWHIAFFRPDYNYLRNVYENRDRTTDRRVLRNTPIEKPRLSQVKYLEKLLIKRLKAHKDVTQYESNVRTNVRSEWFISKVGTMHEIFKDLYYKDLPGGNLTLFNLTKEDSLNWNKEERRNYSHFIQNDLLLGYNKKESVVQKPKRRVVKREQSQDNTRVTRSMKRARGDDLQDVGAVTRSPKRTRNDDLQDNRRVTRSMKRARGDDLQDVGAVTRSPKRTRDDDLHSGKRKKNSF